MVRIVTSGRVKIARTGDSRCGPRRACRIRRSFPRSRPMTQPAPLSIHDDGMDAWYASAPGRYTLAWEQAAIDGAVADIFGYNALQLGLPQLAALRGSRIPLRQTAGEPG